MIYLDYNATAPLWPAVKRRIIDALDVPGNPSSVHSSGRNARALVEKARGEIASSFGATHENIIFTSGATEANTLALAGSKRRRVLVSGIEHLSVLEAVSDVEKIAVDQAGLVSSECLANLLRQDANSALVSIMLANNETGVIQPIAELARMAHEYGALFHCDAVQAPGRIPLHMDDLGVDMMTLSAHKIGGPKGIGALILAPGVEIASVLSGGGQERGRRGGTENVPAIAGFGAAAMHVNEMLDKAEHISKLRDEMERAILEQVPEVVIHGHRAPRLVNTSLFGVDGVSAETQVIALDLSGIAVSSGSACSSGKVAPSHVLRAMGLSESMSISSVRVSIGVETKDEEIGRFVDAWVSSLKIIKRQVNAAQSMNGSGGTL